MPFFTTNQSLIMIIISALMTMSALTSAASEIGQKDIYSITKITDGDSLRAGDVRIRIHGIDAPEMRQVCTKQESYPCGKQARAFLADMLGQQAEVVCHHLDTDRYGRFVMRCYHQGFDIGAAMVRSGWALAYRRYAADYIADEHDAKVNKRGIWSGSFETPEAWRRNN